MTNFLFEDRCCIWSEFKEILKEHRIALKTPCVNSILKEHSSFPKLRFLQCLSKNSKYRWYFRKNFNSLCQPRHTSFSGTKGPSWKTVGIYTRQGGHSGRGFPLFVHLPNGKIYLQIYLQKILTKNFCQTIGGHITLLPMSPFCE